MASTKISILVPYQTVKKAIKQSYRGADKSLAQPGRKQATATQDFEFHTSYL